MLEGIISVGEAKGVGERLATSSHLEISVDLLFDDCCLQVRNIGSADTELGSVGNSMRVEGDRQFLCGRGNAENLGNGILCSLSTTGTGNLLRKEQCPSPNCCDSGSPHGRTFQQRTARAVCGE